MERKDEINEAMATLGAAIKADEPSPGLTEAVVILVGGALIDLARIADAVSKLATFEVDQIGEILHVGPNFSAEEVATIEALRRGEIACVPMPDHLSGAGPEWLPWDGKDAAGPSIPANTLVDVRFRASSDNRRNADQIGVNPITVSWLNTGRPTNADVEYWRISAVQADPSVAKIYS